MILDGTSLTLQELYDIGVNHCLVELTERAWEKIGAAAEVVQNSLKSPDLVYGINTGFGSLASVKVEDVNQLQINLIRSHSAGVGNFLTRAQTRRLFCCRINTLARGYSGISKESLERMIKIFNADCCSTVPIQGSVGCSGDLAPLAHLALGLIGEGQMYDPNGVLRESQTVLDEWNLKKLELQAKEGLALINGTQFVSSLGCEACLLAKNLLLVADFVAAFTLEVLHGTPTSLREEIHEARNQKGQVETAERMRRILLPSSELFLAHEYKGQVQDAYSLRCISQVHGICRETFEFCYTIMEREINAGTDNPMIVGQDILSGGNFHGEYPAKVLDYLAIAVAELGSISERRIERLLNPHLNQGLPAFLVPQGGLNSGFMIVHCTAAALSSENQVLVHPSSSHSLPTSASKEDHVSMGPFSARKALEVIRNVETVLAAELMCACQALDFRRPSRSTKIIEAIHKIVRSRIPTLSKDRVLSSDIETTRQLISLCGEVSEKLKTFNL